jgi:hypothetical protein
MCLSVNVFLGKMMSSLTFIISAILTLFMLQTLDDVHVLNVFNLTPKVSDVSKINVNKQSVIENPYVGKKNVGISNELKLLTNSSGISSKANDNAKESAI